MQNYLWILNALTEHYGHLKQWGQDRNAKILFFFSFSNKLFGYPSFTDEVLKAGRKRGESPVPSPRYSPSVSAVPDQDAEMDHNRTVSHTHIPQRWHGCSVVQNVGHKCSPFLREEALALEHKPFSPFHGLQSVWNSPDLWVLRVCFLLSLLSSPKSRE